MDLTEEFHSGITACLRSWSALRTAVESGWGGGPRESQAKADNLRRSILEVLDGSQYPPANCDMQDLSDNLAIYMEEEFSVTLEDNSEVQVAEEIFKMYEGCMKGDPALARQMVARAESAVAFNSQFPVQLQTTEHDDDDDDEDMVDNDSKVNDISGIPSVGARQPQTITIPSDYNSTPLFGPPAKTFPASTAPVRQLGEPEPEKHTAEMDDDGFALVQPKGRRKR